MDAARGMAIFIVVFIVIPWGLLFGLRLSAAAAATTTCMPHPRTSRWPTDRCGVA